MERGESSADRTRVKDVRAETTALSGAWKAGEREGIMDGVRRRTEGLVDGEVPGWCCGCESGTEVRSGRKLWRVRIGLKRRVLRMSDRVFGDRVAIGAEG